MTTNLFYFHQLSLYRAPLCQHSGPDRLFPSGLDSIYGLGLFWCKEDWYPFWTDQLLTITSLHFHRVDRCNGPYLFHGLKSVSIYALLHIFSNRWKPATIMYFLIIGAWRFWLILAIWTIRLCGVPDFAAALTRKQKISCSKLFTRTAFDSMGRAHKLDSSSHMYERARLLGKVSTKDSKEKGPIPYQDLRAHVGDDCWFNLSSFRLI